MTQWTVMMHALLNVAHRNVQILCFYSAGSGRVQFIISISLNCSRWVQVRFSEPWVGLHVAGGFVLSREREREREAVGGLQSTVGARQRH